MANINLKPILFLAVVTLLSSVFAFISLCVFIFNIIKKGPRRMLCTQNRNVMPNVLYSDEFGEHKFIRLQNSRIKLHCVVSGSSDKPLMLFLHGFPEFWYSWRYQLKEFSKDFRTVAVDMRGYGESDKPSGILQYTMDKLVDDVDQLIVALGYEKCILVAHDWGGAVAWCYASLHPERVHRLIVCNCPHTSAFQQHIQSSLSQLLKSSYMYLFQAPILPELLMRADDCQKLTAAFCGRAMGAKKGTFSPTDMEMYKYTFNNFSDMSGPLNYYRAAMRYDSVSLHGRRVTAPTMMVWGTKDGALEKRMAELSGRYVDNYVLQYVEGASHWVQQEEPAVVNKHIREFLANNVNVD